jgi:plastocyanin
MSSLRSFVASKGSLWRGAKACAVVGALLLLAAVPLTAAHPIPVARQESSGGGPGGGPGNRTMVNLTATDAPAFTPASVTVTPGALVEFRITSTGSLDHTFTLAKSPNHRLAQNITPTQLNDYLNANGSFVNLSLSPRSVSFANVSLPSDSGGDSFEFLSAIPYQFQAGMFGFLNVSAVPTGPPVVLAVSALSGTTQWDPAALAVNVTSYPVAVTVQVTNLGTAGHTWWLSPFPNYNLSSGNFTAFFQAHPPLAAVNLASSAGGVVDANFTISQPGVYEYICTIPGHFANGMFGFVYVGVPAPAPPASPGTAIVQEGVLAVGAAFLGVAGLLSVVASFTGRFPRPPNGGASHH